MFERNICNQHVEKIEFLPDEYEIDVTRIWCQSMIAILERKEDYWELLNIINCYVHNAYEKNKLSGLPTNYVTIPVGKIKRIIEVCGEGCFCCVFPYDYDKIADDFLNNKLGNIKNRIDLLLLDDNLDEAIKIALSLADIYLKRLSLLYIKSIYNMHTKKMIEEFTNARRKSIHKINSILYY